MDTFSITAIDARHVARCAGPVADRSPTERRERSVNIRAAVSGGVLATDNRAPSFESCARLDRGVGPAGARPAPRPMNDFTNVLAQAASGSPAALEEFARLAYPELRKIARARLYQSGPASPLGTTTLVQECFLRLLKDEPPRSEDRKRFFAYASKVMRSIIVDMVREAGAQKRGADLQTTLDTAALQRPAAADDLLQVDSALADLAKRDPQLAQIVEMRFFAGLTESEIAEALDSSVRTVRRQWEKARLLLADLLAPGDA